MLMTDTVLCAACLGSHQTRVGSPRRGETRLTSWRADPVRRKPRRATHVSEVMLPSLPDANSVLVSVLMEPGQTLLAAQDFSPTCRSAPRPANRLSHESDSPTTRAEEHKRV